MKCRPTLYESGVSNEALFWSLLGLALGGLGHNGFARTTPTRADLARTGAVGQELRVVRDDALPERGRRIAGLGAEGRVALRLPRDAHPPPRGARSRRRRRGVTGERASVVLKGEFLHRGEG